MAEIKDPSDSNELQSSDCSFVWDETTQLFFHASSGFYHDPNAGWYYSSIDGLYYKFENGNYVLWESEKVTECEISPCEGTVTDNPVQDDRCKQVNYSSDNHSSIQPDESEAYQCIKSGHTECTNNQTPENPPPPSEWLEQTLIDLYLSGYNQEVNPADGAMISLESDEKDEFKFSAEDAGNSDTVELEEGEWIPEDGFTDSDVSWDEENWRSQYGQVIQSEEEPVLGFQVVDLWDWRMVTEYRNDGKDQVFRLVGQLVRRSAKLHPSMPSGRRVLKTAPICEVRLDLVRVTTGQVYKLRSPSAKYLASLSGYDSSNPTKDWSFPELSVNRQIPPLSKSSRKSKPESSDGVTDCKDTSTSQNQLSAPEKHRSGAYRDRAAERRILHGGFGVGPGQKRVGISDVGRESSPIYDRPEEAAAEALNMSFGVGSYARRMLEGMGWKEGEALGNSSKGLVEPIEAVGNTGSAGLGWPQGIKKRR